ncbi:MAG: AarF/ABC1/UbiB kinase family protein, partial [Thermoanaerobaculia bacterium]|nr:AarF/ABC1/UbiB kinase family protein [Thermoanaerobaculia bacterium]
MGRVGGSMIGNRAAAILRSGPTQEAKKLENLIRNATRVVETLGEMRGAAMKIGQMLSLQEGFLPPEVHRILQALQAKAPQVPSEVMRYEVEGALGGTIEDLFLEFDSEAHAAASIGQVHRARLHDGRRVAVKVQYPLIREVVTADLANLKILMKSLFSMVFDTDFEPLWVEMRDRLLEELDYEHEANVLQRFRNLHRDVAEIVIPEVIDEFSSNRVLTMAFEEGLTPDEACSHSSEVLRDRWGAALLEFQLRGLLEHRLLHADPNLANFAFRTDGKVVVFDFGSVKEVPRDLARAYARILLTGLEDRWEATPEALAGLGLTRADGSPLD